MSLLFIYFVFSFPLKLGWLCSWFRSGKIFNWLLWFDANPPEMWKIGLDEPLRSFPAPVYQALSLFLPPLLLLYLFCLKISSVILSGRIFTPSLGHLHIKMCWHLKYNIIILSNTFPHDVIVTLLSASIFGKWLRRMFHWPQRRIWILWKNSKILRKRGHSEGYLLSCSRWIHSLVFSWELSHELPSLPRHPCFFPVLILVSLNLRKLSVGKKCPWVTLYCYHCYYCFFLICEFKKHSKKQKITEYLATFYIPPFSLINLGVWNITSSS